MEKETVKAEVSFSFESGKRDFYFYSSYWGKGDIFRLSNFTLNMFKMF